MWRQSQPGTATVRFVGGPMDGHVAEVERLTSSWMFQGEGRQWSRYRLRPGVGASFSYEHDGFVQTTRSE